MFIHKNIYQIIKKNIYYKNMKLRPELANSKYFAVNADVRSNVIEKQFTFSLHCLLQSSVESTSQQKRLHHFILLIHVIKSQVTNADIPLVCSWSSFHDLQHMCSLFRFAREGEGACSVSKQLKITQQQLVLVTLLQPRLVTLDVGRFQAFISRL